MKNETAAFWRGNFGDDYNRRNVSLVEKNVAFLARALARAHYPIRSVLEFGCGTGQNLEAFSRLVMDADLAGIEINEQAGQLAAIKAAHVWRMNALEWTRPPEMHWDLVLSKGFLIHVDPENLTAIYQKMFEASNRFILIAEYYNPAPVMIEYRGEKDRLWKRDFATEILGRYPTLRVADYGFIWRHDHPWNQDDLTYFLLEKR